MSIAIVTDTVSNLSFEQAEEHNIFLIPLSVIFGQEVYEDMFELDTREFYEKMRQSDKLPTTSQPTVGQFTSFYQSLAEDYDQVLSIHIGEFLSGTYANAFQVANDLESIDIHVFDTQTASAPQGQMAKQAARMAQDGASISQIIEKLEEMRESAEVFAVMDTLENLIKGGRLSNVAGGIASLLKIKPIITLQKEKLYSYEKVRTEKKAFNRLVEIAEEKIIHAPYSVSIDILHSNSPKKAEQLKESLLKIDETLILESYNLTPVIGVHTGEEAVGFSIIRNYDAT